MKATIHTNYMISMFSSYNRISKTTSSPSASSIRYGKTYELAGYGGGSGDDAPGGDVLDRGPQKRQGVDAGMVVEPAVLDADGNQRQPFSHLGERDGDLPLRVRGEPEVKKASPGVVEGGGRLDAGHLLLIEGDEEIQKGECRDPRENRRQKKEQARAKASSCADGIFDLHRIPLHRVMVRA